jgi:hypothetical protein
MWEAELPLVRCSGHWRVAAKEPRLERFSAAQVAPARKFTLAGAKTFQRKQN